MIDVTMEEKGRVGLVKLDGEMTIKDSAGLKKSLLKALDSSDTVYVDVSKVSEVDIACLQILCSAHRTAVTMKKELKLSGAELSGIFRQKAADSGFARHVGCALDAPKSCIWAIV